METIMMYELNIILMYSEIIDKLAIIFIPIIIILAPIFIIYMFFIIITEGRPKKKKSNTDNEDDIRSKCNGYDTRSKSWESKST